MWRAKCVCSLRCYSPIKQKKTFIEEVTKYVSENQS